MAAPSAYPAPDQEPKMRDALRIFEDESGLNRILLFSDAVMAIAITLLVIDLKVPEVSLGLGRALRELWPNYLGYLLSFFIIGNYWMSHHRLFRPIIRYDDRLMLLSLVFLFFIALIPFSTKLIALHPASRTAVIVYSLNILPLGLISKAMTHHAYVDHRLIDSSWGPADILKQLDFTRRGTVVFLTCLIVSVAFPPAFWIVWFLGFTGRSIGRRFWKVS
jgi:uncharacterized membrane protein